MKLNRDIIQGSYKIRMTNKNTTNSSHVKRRACLKLLAPLGAAQFVNERLNGENEKTADELLDDRARKAIEIVRSSN